MDNKLYLLHCCMLRCENNPVHLKNIEDRCPFEYCPMLCALGKMNREKTYADILENCLDYLDKEINIALNPEQKQKEIYETKEAIQEYLNSPNKFFNNGFPNRVGEAVIETIHEILNEDENKI